MYIRQSVHDAQAEAVRIRRELHRIPETAYNEYKTQKFVYDYLKALEPDKLEKMAGTGVRAVFLKEGASRTTAFRADMDALPLKEETGLPFASEYDGIMHACGHDAHMAITLTTAYLVAHNRKSLRENAVFIFQPAEEGGNGAAYMIRDGALENPHVDRIYGQHVMPGVPVGTIEIRPGVFTARAMGFNITVWGKQSHGARPHLGNDAIVAAAQLVVMMQSIISRNVNPDDSAVLTIGSINGGNRRNIVCAEVVLACTLRTFSDEVHDLIIRRVKEMLSGLESAFGVCTDFAEVQDYPSVVNDEQLAREYAATVEDAASDAARQTIGEDFAMYQKETKGLFVSLGVGDQTALHTPTFDIDEEAMKYSIEANMRLLRL